MLTKCAFSFNGMQPLITKGTEMMKNKDIQDFMAPYRAAGKVLKGTGKFLYNVVGKPTMAAGKLGAKGVERAADWILKDPMRNVFTAGALAATGNAFKKRFIDTDLPVEKHNYRYF